MIGVLSEEQWDKLQKGLMVYEEGSGCVWQYNTPQYIL